MKHRFRMWDFNEKNKHVRRRFIRQKDCPHCGKIVLNTRYRFHLLIHSLEKPFQCLLCHSRFFDTGSLDEHKRLFHRNKRLSFDDSLKFHTAKPCSKITTPKVEKVESYLKEYRFSTTASDRRSRYEARALQSSLSAGNTPTSTRTPVQNGRKNFRVITIHKDKRTENERPRPISCPRGSTTLNPIVLLKRLSDEVGFTKSNGVIRCLACDDIFYQLDFFKWHWKSEHHGKKMKSDSERAVLSSPNVIHYDSKLEERASTRKEMSTVKAAPTLPSTPLSCGGNSAWKQSRKLIDKYMKLDRAKTKNEVDILKAPPLPIVTKKEIPVDPPISPVQQAPRLLGSPFVPYGFKCPYCGNNFSNVYDFKVHIAGHEGRRVHKCFFCSHQFLSLSHLETHLKAMHKLLVG